MTTLDSRIDELYNGPLAEFVGARTALAKILKGDEAKRVKALAKPTVVPWAVNQVYWQARELFDRVVHSGATLRKAQLAALSGRSADVRGASEAHRQAVAGAVAAAMRLAAEAGLHPSGDALTRMFDAISIAGTPPAQPGRFTELLQPAGFEALEGVTVKAVAPTPRALHAVPDPPHKASSDASPRKASSDAHAARLKEEARRREREQAAAARQKKAAIEQAEHAVTRAKKLETSAREDLERATAAREEAERALATLRSDG